MVCVVLKPSGPVIPNTTLEPAGSPPSVTLSDPISRVNCAVTLFAELIVTTHDPVPVQPPLQPEKSDPVAGVAANVTLLPEAKLALHVKPQLMPTGVLVTVPVPVPLFDTVSNCEDAPLVVKLCVVLVNVPSEVTNRARQ
jgi:hypothetical protein